MNEIDKYVFSNTARYFEIAKNAYNNALNFSKKRDAELIKTNSDLNAMFNFAEMVHKESITSVIFCVMTLESIINEYGLQNKSKNFYNEHLDNLKLLSKFIVLPKLFGGNELNTDGQEFQNLKWLIKLRNDLTHSKLTERNIRDLNMTNPLSQNLHVLEHHAKKAIQTVKSVSTIIDSEMTIHPTQIFVPDI
jgi:hypothetical protein